MSGAAASAQHGALDQTCVLMGVPVDDVTLAEAVERISAMVTTGRATGRVHQVATVNVDFVVNAASDPALLEILQRSDMTIPDGMPLVWASRWLGSPLRARTTGIDLLPAIAERAAADGDRIVFFGGAPGVADRAAEILRQRFAGVSIDVVAAPNVAPDGGMDPAVLPALAECRPDIVCVALGNPKQEHWIARHGSSIGAPVFIGIGGSLDFLAGITRRAPAWMQRSGLEWLHRAVSEPRRLVGRYAHDLRVFGPGIVRQARRGRRRGEAIAAAVEIGADGSPVLALLGPLPVAMPEAAIVSRLRAGEDVHVDLSRSGPLDNVTISTIAGLVRSGRRNGAAVTVVNGPSTSPSGRRIDGAGAMFDRENRHRSGSPPSTLRPRGG